MNMDRMRRTAARAALPDFDAEELIKIMVEMVGFSRLELTTMPINN